MTSVSTRRPLNISASLASATVWAQYEVSNRSVVMAVRHQHQHRPSIRSVSMLDQVSVSDRHHCHQLGMTSTQQLVLMPDRHQYQLSVSSVLAYHPLNNTVSSTLHRFIMSLASTRRLLSVSHRHHQSQLSMSSWFINPL